MVHALTWSVAAALVMHWLLAAWALRAVTGRTVSDAGVPSGAGSLALPPARG